MSMLNASNNGTTTRPSPTGHRRLRPAFSLMELMIAVGLFTTVALLASKTLHSAIRTTASAEAAHTAIMQWEQATRSLRRDVWGSTKATVADGHAVTITLSDGTEVNWTADKDGALQRVAPRTQGLLERNRWTDLGRTVRFEAPESGELVIISERNGQPAIRLSLSPAIAIMEGNKQ